jgi:hypothetical protein
VQFRVGVAVVEHGAARELGGGGGAQPGRAGAHLEAGACAVERLALLAGQQLGQRLGRRLDRVGRAQQEVDALGVGAGGPRRLRGAGSDDGGVEVLGGPVGDPAHDLARRRVEDLPAVGVGDAGQQAVVRGRLRRGGHGLGHGGGGHRGPSWVVEGSVSCGTAVEDGALTGSARPDR